MGLLEQHFDVAFAAPDGIKKLRELILTLAMQGKLVPQDPNDEPASELLQEIEAEKKRLVKEKHIRATRLLPEIDLENVPYILPNGWKWVQLGNIAILENGDRSNKYPNETDHQISGVPFFGAKDIVNGVLRFDNGLRFISEAKFLELSNGKLVDKDFVVLLRGTVGKMAIFLANPEFSTGFINAQMLIVRMLNKELCDFFSWYSSSNFFQSLVANKITGSAVRQMPANVLLDFIVPLPPLAEQRRIVAKIDQLMARCDELEKLRIDRSQRLLTVHTAALDRLLTAKDSSEFSTAWNFITQHFGELYSVKENVVELRKTILQLAVMGKLVRQDPNDEPASELLRSIELEKQRLVKEGKIKQPKPLPEIDLKDVPYELPKGWKWVRLGELTQVITKGSSPNWQGIQYVDEGEGILFVTSENVGSYNLLLNKKKFVESRFNEIEPRSILQRKDILMNIVGASIGRTAIFDLDVVANINQAVTIIRLIDLVDYKYFLHFFNSPVCISYMYDKQVDNARPNLSMGNISIFNIPLPPLAEQRRIVEEIDRLMGMCDRLEESISSGKGKQTDLLNALMSQV
jgi:type I restriction enzyme, S subunit